MKRSNPRWRKAFNWAQRCAHRFPGVVASAAIGDYRLSCVVQNGKQHFKGWYVFGENHAQRNIST